MAQIPSVEIVVSPVRVHGESVAVLVRELDEVERELFDVRGFYDEEVRLCKALSDENAMLWAFRHSGRRRLANVLDERDELRDALDTERTKAKKRDRWLGVALGATFALGGYFGFMLGCAQ